jgi:HopA1 effector protein family
MNQTWDAEVADLAGAVRILSMRRFEIAGRFVETNVPMPGSVPQIPLINQLADELYTHAYRVRIGDGSSVDDCRRAAVPHDLVPMLSAANESRSTVDPGWLIIDKRSSSSVVVFKNGMVREIPVIDIERQAQPKRLASIHLRRETTNTHFYFAHGETPDSTRDNKPLVRFYWNVAAAGAVDLTRTVTRSLNGLGVPFAFKCPRVAADYNRFDAGILYVRQPYHDVVASTLPELHATVVKHLRPEVPLFTKKLGHGLGFAEDPGGGKSFGMFVCELLAEAFWSAFARGISGPENVLRELRRYLLLQGISLRTPWMNRWSIDRYNHPILDR